MRHTTKDKHTYSLFCFAGDGELLRFSEVKTKMRRRRNNRTDGAQQTALLKMMAVNKQILRAAVIFCRRVNVCCFKVGEVCPGAGNNGFLTAEWKTVPATLVAGQQRCKRSGGGETARLTALTDPNVSRCAQWHADKTHYEPVRATPRAALVTAALADRYGEAQAQKRGAGYGNRHR